MEGRSTWPWNSPYTYPKHLGVRMLVPSKKLQGVEEGERTALETHGGLQVGRGAHMDSQWRNTQCKEQGTLRGTRGQVCVCSKERHSWCVQLWATWVSCSGLPWAPVTLQAWPYSAQFQVLGWTQTQRFQVRLEVVTALHKPPLQLQEAWRCEPTFLPKLPASSEILVPEHGFCSCACVCVCVYMYTDSNMGPLRIQPPPLRGANWN